MARERWWKMVQGAWDETFYEGQDVSRIEGDFPPQQGSSHTTYVLISQHYLSMTSSHHAIIHHLIRHWKHFVAGMPSSPAIAD